MNKFFIILSHTYGNRIKSKAFIITTVLMAAAILFITNIQTVMDFFQGDEDGETSVALIADEPEASALAASIPGGELYEGEVEEAKESVKEGEHDGLLVVEKGETGLPKGHYYTDQLTSSADTEVRQALQQVKMNAAARQQKISGEALAEISTPVEFETTALEEGAKSEEELSQARAIVYIMLFVMYLAVIMYGNIIATEVTTEKSSRVMEILISSVSPVTQMFGKITGVALVGLTQFGVFILSGFIGIRMADSSENSLIRAVGLSNPDWGIISYAVIYFLLGYLLYATLAAMLGSLVSRVEDAQQTVTPMTMVVVIAFFFAISALSTPDAAYIVIASYIPFFTPFVMFTRIGVGEVPLWEVGLSFGILIGSIVLLGIIGARIYRGGVLMYSSSSLLKNTKEALQLSKKE